MKAPSGPNLPAWFREHIVCWYSPKRQGCTDASLTADPTLIDLSGKGNDAEIHNLKTVTTEGLKYGCNTDGSILFAASTYAQCKTRFILTDFTIIADRDLSQITLADNYRTVAGKSHAPQKGAFVFEGYTSNGIASFGHTNQYQVPRSRGVSVMTPLYYNGKPIVRGAEGDTESDVLVINAARASTANRENGGQVRLYSFLLFDKTLSQDQIDYVKNNLID